eukprot:6464271-Amphidinium_carterae.1
MGLHVASKVDVKVRGKLIFDVSATHATPLMAAAVSDHNTVLLVAGPVLPSSVRFPARAAKNLIEVAMQAKLANKAVVLFDSPATHKEHAPFRHAHNAFAHWLGCSCSFGGQEHVQISALFHGVAFLADLEFDCCPLSSTRSVVPTSVQRAFLSLVGVQFRVPRPDVPPPLTSAALGTQLYTSSLPWPLNPFHD